MARHVIPFDYDDVPDLVWDDEVGTVEGDSGLAVALRAELAETPR